MNQELAILSKDSNSKLIETNSKRSILLFKIPNLNLYVITDCMNFGSNWIEINYVNQVYTTKYLMGSNEDLFSAIARKFAQDIIETKKSPNIEDEMLNLNPRTIMINIALKNTDPNDIRDIGNCLRDF